MFRAVILYVGPPENAAKYQYKVKFVNNDNTEGVSVTHLTIRFHENLDDIFQSGNCWKLRYYVSIGRTTQEGELKCECEILRVSDWFIIGKGLILVCGTWLVQAIQTSGYWMYWTPSASPKQIYDSSGFQLFVLFSKYGSCKLHTGCNCVRTRQEFVFLSKNIHKCVWRLEFCTVYPNWIWRRISTAVHEKWSCLWMNALFYVFF